jgi:hypothetical protein
MFLFQGYTWMQQFVLLEGRRKILDVVHRGLVYELIPKVRGPCHLWQ